LDFSLFGNLIRQGMPDEIPVCQARNLPPAFFRFLLTKDTLALGYVLGAITRTRDFHPLENTHTERTKNTPTEVGVFNV
jgi:hypothetical protein